MVETSHAFVKLKRIKAAVSAGGIKIRYEEYMGIQSELKWFIVTTKNNLILSKKTLVHTLCVHSLVTECSLRWFKLAQLLLNRTSC
jgi:hypothetical protein